MINSQSKDFRKRTNFYKIALRRSLFFSFLKNPKLSFSERQFLYFKLHRFVSLNTSPARFHNHCLFTHKTRSVYKYTKLSRHVFKKLVLNGLLPGWGLSSW
jgi:ribosomal protein S14